MNAAAVILCAGKGTRMNDDSQNKVCFDCAGIPTIKRIISNMKKAGVSRFVIVIGHQAYSVMNCLDGEDGVVYAYQKEQKGTGHAALCGLNALKTVGYSGPVIISMGDKIISTQVIKDLITNAKTSKAVWGVQPIKANFSGGRVVVLDNKPYGVVEFADAVLMHLASFEEKDYEKAVKETGINAQKGEKVIKKAKAQKPQGEIALCGRTFNAKEILSTNYANAGLYCFDLERAVEIIKTLGSNNAQGEIYLTDALEKFAQNGEACLYEVSNPTDMLTYSTKPELKVISRHFMRTASKFIEDINCGELDDYFTLLYGEEKSFHKDRYIKILQLFIEKYGDKKVVITRAPGRVNLMGRHIDHRGGAINVITTDKDLVFVSAPRDDDIVNIANVSDAYPERSFSIKKTLGDIKYDNWLDYLNDERVKKELQETNGDWCNYVKSSVIRAQFEFNDTICGMDMAAGGTLPVAAGISSSSSIVVSVMEAVVALNALNITDRQFIELCGEGEWFVGSRGGAGDQASMKCGKSGRIVHIKFKPMEVVKDVAFSDKYAVLLANSMIKAKKSEGSKDKFNAKVASYEFALMLMNKYFPKYRFAEFRDVAKVRPYTEIYEILKAIPETLTRGSVKALLPEYAEDIKRIFATHKDPGIYDIRGVALFGVSECVRAEQCLKLLEEGNYKEFGEFMKISHDGDRIKEFSTSDEYLQSLIDNNVDISKVSGTYNCSTEQIDYLVDMLNSTDGVLGSEIIGAGLGGCVIALIEKDKADKVLDAVNKNYYDKYGYEHSANVCTASHGSKVVF